jgi:hypothetical protein
MKRILIISFVTIATFNLALAQKRTTMFGDMWSGEVIATNDDTREITIKYDVEGRMETFTGILVKDYDVKMKDGSTHRLKVSEIPIGTRIRVLTKPKEQAVGGRKVKVNSISYIEFLKEDEFLRLRKALNLEPSFPVTFNESGSLSPAMSLKIYLFIEDDGIKNRFIDWVSKWNKEQAMKYGSLELVSSFAEANVSLVVLKNAGTMEFTPSINNMAGRAGTFPLSAVSLASKKSYGLEVIWEQFLITNPDSKPDTGQLETEITKRMKARLKK